MINFTVVIRMKCLLLSQKVRLGLASAFSPRSQFSVNPIKLRLPDNHHIFSFFSLYYRFDINVNNCCKCRLQTRIGLWLKHFITQLNIAFSNNVACLNHYIGHTLVSSFLFPWPYLRNVCGNQHTNILIGSNTGKPLLILGLANPNARSLLLCAAALNNPSK